MRFAVGMITYQEGQWFLHQALESVWGWADQIVVVDGSNAGPSTDDTERILQEFHDRSSSKTHLETVRLDHPCGDYSAQAQEWLGRIDPEIDYILRVDADEIFHKDDLQALSAVAEAHRPDTILFEYRHFWKNLYQIQTTGCYNQRVNLVLRCFRNQPGLQWFGVGGDEIRDSQGRWLKGHPVYAQRAFWAPVKCYHVGHVKTAQFEHAKTMRYRMWDGKTPKEAEETWGICGWTNNDMGGVFPYIHGEFCSQLNEKVDLPTALRPENYEALSPLARYCSLNTECDKTNWRGCDLCLARAGLVERGWEGK
jgi:hypothetical protein